VAELYSLARRRGPARKIEPWTVAVRDDAIAQFRAEHPGLQFAPVLVVIAALDEADAIGDVLRDVPAQACGLEVQTLVVDDGSTDATAGVAGDAGAYVVRLARNLGHGVALRVEVLATVPQQQVQYQTSELLIGAIAQGYRVTERPIVMRKRLAGESKKGHNVLYGVRYARVILTTWWRTRR
jgi:glycosyltransferase involved in cell wall biosynthesis